MEERAKKKAVRKLSETARNIRKARKNTKAAEKEAKEFEEIRNLLKGGDNCTTEVSSPESNPTVASLNLGDKSLIPLSLPKVEVFNEELAFSLFREENCRLENFLDNTEKCVIFGQDTAVPSEECFRQFIAYHVVEAVLPEEGKFSSVGLYILYLMSVHEDPDFVGACFDFLKAHPFHLCPEDIFPVFVNFGAGQEDFDFCKESFVKRFHNVGRGFNGHEYPYYNLEMVGETLLYYITGNFIKITLGIKSLVRGLTRITLDSKIRCRSLYPLFSTIVTALCTKLLKEFQLEEILLWLHLKEEHLLCQLEICRIISKLIIPELQEALVVSTISHILKSESFPTQTPIEIGCLKSALCELRRREFSPVEVYSVLQLINSSLPGVTATEEDSLELEKLLSSLEWKLSTTEDSVDLLRLRLEIAKARNVVVEKASHRLIPHGTLEFAGEENEMLKIV